MGHPGVSLQRFGSTFWRLGQQKELFVTNLPSRVKSLLNENATPIYRGGLGLRTMDTLPACEPGVQGFNIVF